MDAVDCPVCATPPGSPLWSKQGAAYIRCRSCGLVYESPRLSGDELRAFYSDEGYYVRKNPGEPVTGYENYFAQCSPALVEEYFRIVAKSTGGRTGRFLDVGCGTGSLVARARQAGWEATGQEISAWACAQARKAGLPVFEGALEEMALPADSLDAVSMFDVLEHLPSPVPTLREIHRVMKPGGVLVIETPNVDGFFARHFYRERSDVVKPRAHICLYGPRSIRALFDRVPFTRLDVGTFPYCRRFTFTYFKALLASRVMPGRVPVQLTWDESLRIMAVK